GLNRYDGYEFHVYERNREDANSLQEDHVMAMDGDADGNVWVATRTGGVGRLDYASGLWTTFSADAGDSGSLSSDETRALRIDPTGAVLVGHKSTGVDRIDPQTGRLIAHFDNFDGDPESRADELVEALLPMPDDQVWVGTDDGLYRLDMSSGRITRAPLEATVAEVYGAQSNRRVQVRTLMNDRQGRLWIGTRATGLFILGRDGRVAEHFRGPLNGASPGPLSSNHVAALLQDRAGRIWAATKRGLNLYRPTRGDFAHYKPDSADTTSLSNVRLTTLLEDRTGLLWVGTQNAGINYFNPRSWAFGHYQPTAEEGSNSRVITSFAEADGKLWMGTFGDGIHELGRSPVTGQIVRDNALDVPLDDSNVMTMTGSADGSVWVGLMRGGLRRVYPMSGEVKSWEHDENIPNSLSSNAVMTVFEDSRGVLWAGTHGAGVNRLAPDGTITRITASDGLSDDVAQVVREDRRGRIWVGTDGGGINLLDAQGQVLAVLRSNPSADSLASDNVYALYADESDVLWVGGANGLDRVQVDSDDPASFHFRNYSKREGLSSNSVWGILPDRSGQLWLSTNFGLTRFNPSDGSTRTFHEEHGLQGEDFNFGAALRTSDGALCFGGANGFNAFYPNRLQLNQMPPRTVLTRISKLNTPIDGPLHNLDLLDLGYADDALTIEFAALDFAAPDRNHYAYKLQGFDADWISRGSVRRATYTNLDKGRYTFMVRARNSDGFWNEAPVELSINVQPAPWETWWAYLAYVAAALGAVYLLLRSQRQKLKREEEYRFRLEREVTERTHQLAERAEELKQLNERLKESSFTDPLTG
ncbi:MAG: two-component regulator propeller domain-containing protein, partial [Pseudomonadota bacterium]